LESPVKNGIGEASRAVYILGTFLPLHPGGCMSRLPRLKRLTVFMVLAALGSVRPLLSQQKMDSISRDRATGILRDAYENVKKHYYDPKYHGLDLEARYHEYDAKIRNAPTLSQGFAIVAAFLEGLNDTHTFFSPPPRSFQTDYGYRMQMYGDSCLVSTIRPGTDAATKLHPGDQVLGYNNYNVNRAVMWKMEYYFGVLAPQKASVLALRDPDGQERKVTVEAKVREFKKVMDLTGADGGGDISTLIRDSENAGRLTRQRWINLGDVMIWKMPEFFLADEGVDHLFAEAKKHRALILDLRGNPGGAISTLERMLSDTFDHEVKVADRIGRKELKPEIAKHHSEGNFSGKIVVLIDSGSASSAELFARVMQLEKRGTVIGDRSAGAVMEALDYSNTQGVDTKIAYSFSITEADLIMKDGKSLEHLGVTPDEIVLPTAKDLARGWDPVLSHAAGLVGLNLEPAAAGKMFPVEWMPN
jgi:C-terminal processing protease CtpA/Prc